MSDGQPPALEHHQILDIARAMHKVQPYVFGGSPWDGPDREYLMPEEMQYVRQFTPAVQHAVWQDFTSGKERVSTYAITLLVACRDENLRITPLVSEDVLWLLKLVPNEYKGTSQIRNSITTHKGILNGLIEDGFIPADAHLQTQKTVDGLAAAYKLAYKVYVESGRVVEYPGPGETPLKFMKYGGLDPNTKSIRKVELTELAIDNYELVDSIIDIVIDRRTDDVEVISDLLKNHGALQGGAL